jgi:putative tryptophan/tyrosine transport system substrate-binding protein
MDEMAIGIGRRQFITALGGATVGWPLAARAQQTGKVSRIGLMANLSLRPIDAFKKALQDLGYVEGKNLIIEYRFAEGREDRYAAFATELTSLPVDLIVTWGTPAAFAAKRATTKIPIVLGAIGDVLNTGIVSSLAHPEGNITGFIALNVELEAKRLELLKEIMPRLSRVAVLGNSLNPLNRINLDTARRAAERLSVAIEIIEVQKSQDVEGALGRLIESQPDAALLASDTMLLGERKQIADAMATNKMPAIYPFHEYAEVGGFIMYGAELSILFQRAAGYVDKILKGEIPENLPIQQATAFELIINTKVAAALGLTIPASVLVRADEVIE